MSEWETTALWIIMIAGSFFAYLLSASKKRLKGLDAELEDFDIDSAHYLSGHDADHDAGGHD